ncbi:hypothetical protein PGQ11_010657 [Apiospora arundinis]|uniref:DUF7888 domain-containing protein n=1 Tax=Apiospora arundinis TaxID=335852 RepID=A0ABR2IA99_9PEZI
MQMPSALLSSVFGASVASSSITQGLEPVKKRNNADGLGGRSVTAAVELIKNVSEWKKARDEFSKAKVKGMMEANRDPTNHAAAACYNMVYKLETPANVNSTAILSFKLGSLHTNFDCMYLKGPNTFYTKSDNGYINLAYDYFTDRCTFDKSTGDLTCR